MSIPRRDPDFTVDQLRAAAERFRDAGHAYWEAAHKAGISGAVIWIEMEDGSFVLFTRGEYRHTLLQNIDRIGGPSISFGATAGDEP